MPIRRIPKNHMTVTGLASSGESGGQIGYEGRLEFCFIKLVTFNKNVTRCEEQPLYINFKDPNGKQRSYTLDFRITFRSGLQPANIWKPLLVEVKPRRRLFKNLAEFRSKFRAAARHARAVGEDFAVITEKELRTPYTDNVLFLLKFRSYPADQTALNLLVDTLKKVGNSTPIDLMSVIADSPARRAEMLPHLWQLIANWQVDVNLEEPLTMTSPIKWSPTGGTNIENLHEFIPGCRRRKRWQALRYFKPA